MNPPPIPSLTFSKHLNLASSPNLGLKNTNKMKNKKGMNQVWIGLLIPPYLELVMKQANLFTF